MPVQTVPNGAHGFDANSVLSVPRCQQARAMGFAFAVRYVALGTSPGSGNLSAAEVKAIVSSGLGLMPVQHVAKPGWTPSAASGQANGQNAAAHAASATLPPGINLWVDLEGINHTTPAEDVIAYCNAWCAEVVQAGFVPGVYVGADAILSGDQLYWRLQLKHYWKSGSRVPDIPHRGYQLVQRIVAGDSPFGIDIDRNLATTDSFGDAALMLT